MLSPVNIVRYLESGPIFYFLSWSPSHLEFFLQVTWPFSIFTWTHLAKSQVTSVADLEISWVTLTLLFVFCIFLNSYMWRGWVGLWGFLWWAPSTKRKDHHRVSSGWSSVWHCSNTGLYLGFGHFGWLPSFFGQQHFGGLMVKFYFLCWNYSLSSGWHIIAA